VSRQISPTIKKYATNLPVGRGQPGGSSRVWVFLPEVKTDAPQAYLPCLFYAPAGAPIFGGMLLSVEDELEVMPYVNLGFAVVCYEVDGDVEMTPQTTPEEIVQAAERYFASSAGLVNARNAMHFTLNRFPEIDPERLYTIGHSSAGKQALLWLAHEPRLKGCVAFGPAAALGSDDKASLRQLPSDNSFDFIRRIRRSMPIRHASRIEAPVLIIHSKADTIVPSSQLRRLARKTGDHVQLVEIPGCSHFELPMSGFQIASNWLNQAAFPNATVLSGVSPFANRKPQRVTESRAAGRSMPMVIPGTTVNPFVK
jgi:dienelactone hydrolase